MNVCLLIFSGGQHWGSQNKPRAPGQINIKPNLKQPDKTAKHQEDSVFHVSNNSHNNIWVLSDDCSYNFISTCRQIVFIGKLQKHPSEKKKHVEWVLW